MTNPPYRRGLADAFVKHALKLTSETGGTVAMLVNLLSLYHPLRHDFYVGHPPAVIYALDECICWPYGSVAGHHEHCKATLLLARVETRAPRPDRIPVAFHKERRAETFFRTNTTRWPPVLSGSVRLGVC